MMFALRTVAAFGHYAWSSQLSDICAKCGIDGPAYVHDLIAARTSRLIKTARQPIDGYQAQLTVESSGVVTAKQVETVWAMRVPSATIRVRELYRVNAALADYFLWWAHRLHSVWKAEGDVDALIVGMCCARLGSPRSCSLRRAWCMSWVTCLRAASGTAGCLARASTAVSTSPLRCSRIG